MTENIHVSVGLRLGFSPSWVTIEGTPAEVDEALNQILRGDTPPRMVVHRPSGVFHTIPSIHSPTL